MELWFCGRKSSLSEMSKKFLTEQLSQHVKLLQLKKWFGFFFFSQSASKQKPPPPPLFSNLPWQGPCWVGGPHGQRGLCQRIIGWEGVRWVSVSVCVLEVCTSACDGHGGVEVGGSERGACKQFFPKRCNCPRDWTVQSGNAHFPVYSLSPLYLLIFVSQGKKNQC